MENIEWMDLLGWSNAQIEDLRYVGYSYIKQGKYDIALTFFKALKILAKDTPYDIRTLGALYLERGDNEEALLHLEEALRLEPSNKSASLNRIKALFALGKKNDALEKAKQLASDENPLIARQAEALVHAYAL